ncbi:VanZ family protein [Paenibacillus rhizoplanae]
MTGFILSILVVETIQALTFLGSFDTNDVITNSVGAAIGFGGYKIGFRTKTTGEISLLQELPVLC